jgi:hypothetical protein
MEYLKTQPTTFSPIQALNSLINAEHDLIRDVVNNFDPRAIVVLFGPGSTLPGKTMDVYISSKTLMKSARQQIRNKLVNTYHLNIDMVCITEDVKNEELMREIGMKL